MALSSPANNHGCIDHTQTFPGDSRPRNYMEPTGNQPFPIPSNNIFGNSIDTRLYAAMSNPIMQAFADSYKSAMIVPLNHMYTSDYITVQTYARPTTANYPYILRRG